MGNTRSCCGGTSFSSAVPLPPYPDALINLICRDHHAADEASDIHEAMSILARSIRPQHYIDSTGADDAQSPVPSRRTALMWAAIRGQIELGRILVQAGASLDLQDVDGNTVLMLLASHTSCARRDAEIAFVQELVKAGASLDLRDLDGKTAIMLAAQSIEHGGLMVATLAKAGASLDVMDGDGETALIAAARLGVTENVRELVSTEEEKTEEGRVCVEVCMVSFPHSSLPLIRLLS